MALFAAQQVVDRHAAVGEEHLGGLGALIAELVEIFSNGETGRPLLDHQHAHPAVTRLGLRVGLDEHRQRVGVARVRDPRFGAVDDVVAIFPPCHGGDALQVAAGLRLGERDARAALARCQVGQPSRSLLRLAELRQHQGGQRVRAQDPGDAHPCFRDLLEHDGVRNSVDGDAAVLLRDQHPEQAHRLHLLDDLVRIAAGELHLASDR